MMYFKELLMLIGLIQAKSLSNSKCNCGRFDQSLAGYQRILNGDTAKPHRYPWTVLLEIHHSDGIGDTRCGGTLITKKHVLTAQHCFLMGMSDNNNILFKTQSKLYLGLHDTSLIGKSDSYQAIEITVSDIQHRKSPDEFYFGGRDVSIITLKDDIWLPPTKANPICLPIGLENYDFKNVVLTGWGRISEFAYASQLQMIDLVRLENNECARQLGPTLERTIARLHGLPPEFINQDMMCTAGKRASSNVSIGPCSGDSGSGLFWEDFSDDQRAYIAGVASFGNEDCKADYSAPSVYSYVPRVLQWILKVTGEHAQECSEFDLPLDHLDDWEEFLAEFESRLIRKPNKCIFCVDNL